MPPAPPDWFTRGLPHIWLPYTQMKTAPPPLPVVGAEGCRIQLADGRELIDGIASWWSACHGYRHPQIMKAVHAQLDTLPHVMFGGLAHAPAYELASKLTRIVPDGLTRVFFSDSGSTAVEVALKMALQYWRNKGNSRKEKILCFRHGYHGDTTGAMAVSDPEKSLHKAFRNYVPKQYVLDIPHDEYGFAEFETLLSAIASTTAAMIVEPLVQAAGGMKFHGADLLAALHRLARQHDILFIADEIATGFARTGFLFACDEAGISPDILCLGKALTGGTMTLAATLATEEVFEAFLGDSADAAFMHGPTYMGNPLACAAALASLDLFESEPRIQQTEKIETHLRAALVPCRGMKHVVDVRVKGAIGVVQIDEKRIDLAWLRRRFVEEGVWLRPFSDIVYLMPPLVATPEELTTLTDAVVKVVGEWSKMQG